MKITFIYFKTILFSQSDIHYVTTSGKKIETSKEFKEVVQDSILSS